MEKNIIGKFYAIAFDETVYEFIVYDNKRIECPKLDAKSVYRIIIKPRFMLFADEMVFLNPAKHGVTDGLIKEFNIDDDLFDYLKTNGMIMYSTDMAYLYGFDDKKGHDLPFKKGRPFKWAEKKGPVLVKQKKGQFN